MGYVIGSGWWCDGSGKHEHSCRQGEIERQVYQPDFHTLWLKYIKKFTYPDEIVIIDSNSPITPDKDPLEKWIRLNSNLGHTRGALNAILMSAKYAKVFGRDFIYIEQDLLVHGEGWIDKCYEKAKRKGILLGRDRKGRQPIHIGLIFVLNSKLDEFIQKIDILNLEQLPMIEKHFRKSLVFDYLPIEGYRGIDRNNVLGSDNWYCQWFTPKQFIEVKEIASKWIS